MNNVQYVHVAISTLRFYSRHIRFCLLFNEQKARQQNNKYVVSMRCVAFFNVSVFECVCVHSLFG